MPVFRSEPNHAPAWCTLEHFEIMNLTPGETHTFARRGEREKVMVLHGRCDLEVTGSDTSHPESSSGHKLSLEPSDGEFAVTQVIEPTRILRICGRWGPGCETFGQFTPAGRTPPRDSGDAFGYPKTNGIDRHYHDCDEYWIIVEGRGRAMSEGIFYDVSPGDCVATGMGHHHDFPEDYEPVKAVYMETDLEGQKRKGHLWEYKHGKAEPQPDRV
jgi:mannose-6-phosphate isomerase-like protein (cupin superfamily)